MGSSEHARGKRIPFVEGIYFTTPVGKKQTHTQNSARPPSILDKLYVNPARLQARAAVAPSVSCHLSATKSHRRMVSSCSLALCVRDVWSSRRRKYFSSQDNPAMIGLVQDAMSLLDLVGRLSCLRVKKVVSENIENDVVLILRLTILKIPPKVVRNWT